MITAGRDLYDDPRFFEGYRRLRDSELELTGIDEPVPGPAALQSHPHLAEHLRRPPLLVPAAHRGPVDPVKGVS